MTEALLAEKHPLDDIIRADRLPHIWCPGCGIGIGSPNGLNVSHSSSCASIIAPSPNPGATRCSRASPLIWLPAM